VLAHLAVDGSGEVIRPPGAFTLPADGDIGSGDVQHIECELAQGGEVRGAVVAADAGAVLVETDIEHPVQVVLDAPVSPHGGGELPRIEPSRGQIVAACKAAWDFLINDPQRITSTGSRSWASVNK
jgi:hypothetical protein